MTESQSARWWPDPFKRHELRYWNGGRWTEHVSDRGVVWTDPPGPVSRVVSDVPVGRGSLAGRPGIQAAVRTTWTPAGPMSVEAIRFGAVPAADPFADAIGARLAPSPRRERASAEVGAVADPTRPRASTGGGIDAGLWVELSGEVREPSGRGSGAGPAGSSGAGSVGASTARRSVREAEEAYEPDVWDWRESRLPEIVSGLAVAGLIALAALLGSAGSQASVDEVGVVVSTSTVTMPAAKTSPTTTAKKPGRRSSPTVPGVKLSTAKAPRTTYHASTSARRTTSRPVQRSTSSTTSAGSRTKSATPTAEPSTSSSSSPSSATSAANRSVALS